MTLDNAMQENPQGEQFFTAINGDLFTNTSATELYRSAMPANLFQEDCLHIVAGTDCGLLAKYILQRGAPAGARYLFIEPGEYIQAIGSLPQLAELNIVLCSPETWIDRAIELQLEIYVLKRQVLIHPCLASKGPAAANYLALVDRLFLELDNIAYNIKAPYAGGSMIEMYLQNVSENVFPAEDLKDLGKGKQALIIGAGPSLDDHAQWIRDNRSKFFIFAASRLCRRLIRADILPDAIVSVDSQEINYEQSNWLYRLKPETLLIHSSHVTPRLLGQWHGNQCFTGHRFPWLSNLNRENFQDLSGPTVSNTALVLAGEMAFRDVYLVGVDLCSPKGKTSHSKGTHLKLKDDFIHQVQTYEGGLGMTNINMLHATENLAEQAKRYPNTHFINLSGFACKIEGISHTPISELSLSGVAHEPIAFNLRASSQQLKEHYAEMLQELTRVQRDLKKIDLAASEALSLSKKSLNSVKNDNQKRANKINKLRDKIEKNLDYLNTPLKKAGIDHFIRAISVRDSSELSQQEQASLSSNYYLAYQLAARQLASWVNSSIQRVQSRIEELKDQPSISALCEQWRSDRQQRRAFLWRKEHPASYSALTSEQQNQLLDLEQSFKDVNYRGYQSPELFVGPKVDQAWSLRELVLHQYQKQAFDHDLLEEKLNAADQLPESRKVQIKALFSVCQALAENKYENLFIHIDQVNLADLNDNHLIDLLERSQQQGNSHVVKRCFEQLIKHNMAYLPEYARWLDVSGHHIDSVNSYTQYLQAKPHDISQWQALSDLYQRLGEEELSQTVNSFIHELKAVEESQ